MVEVGGVTAGDTANTTKITFVAAGATIFDRKAVPQCIARQPLPGSACERTSGFLRLQRRLPVPLFATHHQPRCSLGAAGHLRGDGGRRHTATLATNVSTCSLKYEAPGSGSGSGRFGLVSISLGMTQSGETVSLYHQVHVDNTP
jgi:hypothetical protein